MTRMLVLVRHGKAQARTEERADEKRTLTPAGRRALDARFPAMLSLLQIDGDETAQVWTSPAERTVQTADALVDALDEVGVRLEGEVRIENCLWEQDIDAFRQRLRACDADVVFAVGHNPFVEEVCQRVSGSAISFATGAMVALRLADEAKGAPARLLWYAQGPESRLWKTLCFMDRRFAEGADELERRAQEFLADPDEPETCHKLRVSIRTLRSLLAFTEPFMKASFSKRLQRDLRSVVLELSRLRELDVFAGELRGLDAPALDLCAAVESDRDAERDAVVAFLASDKTQKLMARILERLRAIHWKGSIERNGLAPETVRSAFDLMLIDTTARLDELDYADAKETHHVRKECKKARYVSRTFGALLGEDAAAAAKAMAAKQDDLGALCDARVNVALCDSVEDEGLSEDAKANLSALRLAAEAVVNDAMRAHSQVESPLYAE